VKRIALKSLSNPIMNAKDAIFQIDCDIFYVLGQNIEASK
jgi:hypothetical protein